ncbi:MAG: hypothetical protein JO099_12095, partial [Acidobacteriia bacterium]|nr:hypothetical protein [Terriglobia bacterium]
GSHPTHSPAISLDHGGPDAIRAPGLARPNIVGTAEPRIIASLSGFTRYPWVASADLLTATLAVPIFAKLSDMYGRKWFFLGGSAGFVATSALCGAAR